MLDYHVILDMLPSIATLYFTGRLKSQIKMSGVQVALLLAVGLQRKEFSEVEKELNLSSSQLMAMFVKVVRKVATAFRQILEGAVREQMPEAMEVEDEGISGDAPTDSRFKALEKDLQEELLEGGEEFLADQDERERAKALIDALPLHK
jgi:N-acetyltransferase 10